jgi:hypothetical protein
MKVNINEQVSLNLTPYGLEVLKNYCSNLNLVYQGGDVYKTSLWEAFQIFGPVLFMGNTKMPFVNNEIDILNL